VTPVRLISLRLRKTSTMPRMKSTWEDIDLPVLTAAIQYIEDHDYGLLPQAGDLAPILGLTLIEVGKAIKRLDGAYLEMFGTMGGLGSYGVKQIYPEGRRAARQWPSPEGEAEKLIRELQEAADREPDPQRKSKLKAAGAALGDVGVKVVGEVLAKLAAGAM
jgi:hypothetical protein